jgi:hypothetical protein
VIAVLLAGVVAFNRTFLNFFLEHDIIAAGKFSMDEEPRRGAAKTGRHNAAVIVRVIANAKCE